MMASTMLAPLAKWARPTDLTAGWADCECSNGDRTRVAWSQRWMHGHDALPGTVRSSGSDATGLPWLKSSAANAGGSVGCLCVA